MNDVGHDDVNVNGRNGTSGSGVSLSPKGSCLDVLRSRENAGSTWTAPVGGTTTPLRRLRRLPDPESEARATEHRRTHGLGLRRTRTRKKPQRRVVEKSAGPSLRMRELRQRLVRVETAKEQTKAE
ncbi:hypothetical protein MTO96_039308 [Rhipicephalus appendiculatus]